MFFKRKKLPEEIPDVIAQLQRKWVDAEAANKMERTASGQVGGKDLLLHLMPVEDSQRVWVVAAIPALGSGPSLSTVASYRFPSHSEALAYFESLVTHYNLTLQQAGRGCDAAL